MKDGTGDQRQADREFPGQRPDDRDHQQGNEQFGLSADILQAGADLTGRARLTITALHLVGRHQREADHDGRERGRVDVEAQRQAHERGDPAA